MPPRLMRAPFAALWIGWAAGTTTWVLGGDNEDCDTVCISASKICNEEALALVDDADYFEGYVVEEAEWRRQPRRLRKCAS